MTTDPLFSIVTITKNNRHGLARTAKSVLVQTFSAYEWIIIDGASTDGTADDFPLYERAHIISEPDEGLYDAMNKGIEKAHGQYTIFMNAGDCFSDPDILATLSRAVTAEHPDFLYGDALEDHGRYKKARSIPWMLYGMITHHQAMVYKTEILRHLRFDTGYKIAADYDLTLRFLDRADAIHYCPAAFCIFESGGLSQQNRKRGRMEQYKIRHNLKKCPIYVNLGIVLIQSLTSLRKLQISLRDFVSFN